VQVTFVTCEWLFKENCVSRNYKNSNPGSTVSRRNFLRLVGVGASSLLIQSCQISSYRRNKMTNKPIMLYVGTYEHQDPVLTNAANQGIYTYTLDPVSGQLDYHSEINDIGNPSFLAIDSKQRYLYAVDENFALEACLVHAYKIDPKSGSLSYLNQQLSLGSSPCYVTVDQTSQFVAVANYGSGSVSLLPVEENGHLQPASDSHQHTGTGVDPKRQEGPHAHCAVMDPTNQYLFVADLGIDKIMSYRLDIDGKRLIPNKTPYLELPPGSGPRHLTFHQNGRFAYLINELNSTITALNYDDAHGTFTIIHTVSTLPIDFQGESHCAEICIATSGQFLYGSNRGHDSLAIFAIDEETGRLTAVSHQTTYGKTPRNFAIDPSGTFLLAANQDSNNIVTFRINHTTGQLDFIEQNLDIPKPVCLKMIVLR
jgi:6-phosphogluconolactonase